MRKVIFLFVLCYCSVVLLAQEEPEGAAEDVVLEEQQEVTPEQTPVDSGGGGNPESNADETPPEAESETEPEPANPDVEDLDNETNTFGALLKRGRSGQYVDYNNWDSLTSRYAPPQESQRGGIPYVITEARLKEIRSHFMYWYFDMGGTSENEGDWQRAIQASTPQIHKNLNFQLPFFGFRFNYTRVSLNGYLEFSDPPENYPAYPLVFPNKDWPKKNDPSFIGIFFSKCRIGNVRTEDIDQRKPGVYFRLERDLPTRIDKFGVEVRERLKWDIRQGVIGADSFDPKHAVIVTWKNVSFAGGITNSLYTTNTFQLVLATDEVFTYAIFNYLDLQWTTHTEAGGDSLKGEGGVPAYVGFNAGNGTRSFEYTPYSQASVIRDLTGRGWANGFKGRHIFRIDENILLGTCNKDIDGANLPLVFAPESGNMLGGTIVNITGPCFDKNDQVRCKFDVVDEVYGVVVDRNRAICVQPKLSVEGYVRLEISIGSGKYKWKGKYFVETPASATEKIFFTDKKVHDRNPPEIKIKWVKQNLTTNENAVVRLSLWGYRETTIRPEFLYIDTLAEGVQNTGEYTLVPASYRNRDNRAVSDMKFGFIQINLTESIPVEGTEVTLTPVIWSRPIPLGWYFGPQWEGEFGTNWPKAMCDNWLRNDRFLKNFAHELPQCPCTLDHALSDKGRFMPDFDCDKDSNPGCYYNTGAMHCVRSGSPTLEGSEQQCCYDKNGYLMISYDQQWGSNPRRSHNLGYLPWDEANKVPTLSQWYHDIVPKYLCCLWQQEQAVGCETLRFERRPTQDCVAYQPPGVAGVYGDPHFVTFDDLQYTFNGKGEFVLLRSITKDNRLEVQGRFEQLSMNAYGEVRATQLTSVVARGNSSTIIEVGLRPEEARWRYRLDVIANGKRIYFDRPSLKFQHFPGVTVYTPTYILNQSEVIMMFDSGAGVEVVENRGYMTARVYLPWIFINKTRGLLGNWSFDMTDDFVLPDGSKTAISTNLNEFERVYKDFGMHWILEDKDDPDKGSALFHREFGRTSSTYNNKSFIPEWRMRPEDIIPQNRSKEIENAYEYCHEYYECRYDYAMSLNREMAHYTHNYKSTILNLKQINRQRIISCGVLETPRFGRKSTFLFVPGTKVTFECNQDFILIGDQRRECLQSGHWDVPTYGYTECLRQQEYSARQAGVTSGIVLAVLIPIILVLAYFGYVILKRMGKKDDNSWDYGGTGITSPLKTQDSGHGDSRTVSPVTPRSDEEYTYRSPVGSDRSSGASSTGSKKRRSYDKSYKTHEPLKGVPEVQFEDKEWDLELPPDEYEPENKPQPQASPTYSLPFERTFRNKPDVVKLSASDNDLLDKDKKLSYTSDDYAIIRKAPPPPMDKNKRETTKSQSSIITDV